MFLIYIYSSAHLDNLMCVQIKATFEIKKHIQFEVNWSHENNLTVGKYLYQVLSMIRLLGTRRQGLQINALHCDMPPSQEPR